MSDTGLQVANLKREEEIRNALLSDILEELKRFNTNYEKVNKGRLI